MTSSSPRRARPAPSPVSDDPDRAAFLLGVARDVGVKWSSAVRDALRIQGRRAEGAFPGTVGEARARVAEAFDRALHAAARDELSADERVGSTKLVYAAARRHWNVHEERV